MRAKRLGKSSIASFCALSLISASCGQAGGGDSDHADSVQLSTSDDADGRADFAPSLEALREEPVTFAASAPVGALPGSAWADDAGGAHYSIPLDVAPGPNGHAPSLALSYSSHAGNGPVGVGFSVAAPPAVQRCQRTLAKDGYYQALTYGQFDPICYGGQRLILSSGEYGAPGSLYRLEADPSKRFSLKGHLGNGETASWFLTTADNQQLHFRSVDGDHSWPVEEVEDAHGNLVEYDWSVLPDHEVVLDRIVYGGTGSDGSKRKVLFDYEGREDVREGYREGELYRATQRLREVRSEGPNAELLSRYELEYERHPHTLQSILSTVTKFDAAGVALPSTEFEWYTSDAGPIEEVAAASLPDSLPPFRHVSPRDSSTLVIGDFDGNRADEVLAYDIDDEEYRGYGFVAGHDVGVLLTGPELMPEPWEPPPPYPFLCGNGELDPGEECDGEEMSSVTCQAVGGIGAIEPLATCGASCQLDYSECHACTFEPLLPGCEPPEPVEPQPVELSDLHRIKPSLGLSAINFDHQDPRTQLLIPIASEYADDPGVDEDGVSRAQVLRVALPNNVPNNTTPTYLQFDYVEYSMTDSVYSIVPLEFNGDGRDDLFLCEGAAYNDATWRLALSKDVVETGELGWDFHDTGVECSSHDEMTVLPHRRGTEVLAVIPRFSGGVPIDENARGGYHVLNFDPLSGVGSLAAEEVLRRDLYQRYADARCNNAYVVSNEGAPLLNSGLSRDLAIDVDGDGNRDLIRYELAGGDDFSNMGAIQLDAGDATGYHYDTACGGLNSGQDGVLRVYRNTGDGYVAATDPFFTFAGNAHENLFFNWYGAHIVDWNGDGLADVLLPSDGAPDDPSAPYQDEDWTLLLSSGDGEFVPVDAAIDVAWPHFIDLAGSDGLSIQYTSSRIISQRTSWLEDEGVDTWRSSGGLRYHFVSALGDAVVSSRQGTAALLDAATDGQGLRHEFTFRGSSGGYLLRERSLNVPGPGVEYDYPSNFRYWEYEYSWPERDAYGLANVGFEWVRETMLAGGNGYPYDRATELRMYDNSYDSELRAYPRAGRPEAVESAWISDEGDPEAEWHVRCERTTEWATEPQLLVGGHIWQTYSASAEHFSATLPEGQYDHLSPGHRLGPGADGQCDDIPLGQHQTRTISTQTRDDFGNVALSTSAVEEGVSEETSVTTELDFAYDLTNWIIATPTQVETESCVGATCKTRRADIGYQPESNIVDSIVRELGSSFEQTTSFAYESHGNIQVAVVSTPTEGARTITTQWDPEGVVPETRTNDLGQTTSMVFHSTSGLPVATSDPNGITRRVEYDGFFRPVGSSLHSAPLGPSDGSDTSLIYELSAVPGAVLDVVAESQGQETRTSYDRAGRVVRELWEGVAASSDPAQMPALEGPDRCRWYEHDPYGRLRRASSATASCELAPTDDEEWLTHEYDNGGRRTASRWHHLDADVGDLVEVESTVDYPDTNWVTLPYSGVPSPRGYPTIVTDAEGNETTRVVDALGRISATVDALGTVTCFDYGPFSELEAVHRNCHVNAEGSVEVSRYEYDELSRLVSSTEPANGTQTLTYTEFDEVDTTTDAKGQTLDFDYDALGRPEFQHSTEGTTTWKYDGSTIGVVRSQESSDGVRQDYRHDSFGRLIQEWNYMPDLGSPGVWEINAGTSWVFEYGYDEFGRLSSIEYPTINPKASPLPAQDGFTASFHYDASNNLRVVEGASRVLWALDSANEAGLPERELFNEQAGTGLPGQSKDTAYEPFTNRVLAVDVHAASGPLQEFEYEWTPAGNLHRRAEQTTAQSEEFGYDAIHRLIERDGAEIARYDALGNIAYRAGVGDYGYDATTGRLDWAGNPEKPIPHDNNGNIEALSSGASITWSVMDKVRTLSSSGKTLGFVYDADGGRVVRHDTDAYTMTLGGLFEFSDKPGTKPGSRTYEAAYKVPVGGSVVEIRDQLGTNQSAWTRDVLYQYNDHLGSGSVLVRDDGTVEDAVSYGAWGDARSWDDWELPASPAALENLASGFTGHQPELDMGLINMRGRMYSPVLARFLSVDPVVESVGNAQTWNAYSYLQNNPLNATDPSGYSAVPPIIGLPCELTPDFCGNTGGGGGGGTSEPATDPSSSNTGGNRTDDAAGQSLPGPGSVPTGGSSSNPGNAGGSGGKSGAGGTKPNGAGQGGPFLAPAELPVEVQIAVGVAGWVHQRIFEPTFGESVQDFGIWVSELTYEDVSGAGHNVLDGIGFVPHPAAQIADVLNLIWYTLEDDPVNAGISAIAVFNDGAKAGRLPAGTVQMWSGSPKTARAARPGRNRNNTKSPVLQNSPYNPDAVDRRVGRSNQIRADAIDRSVNRMNKMIRTKKAPRSIVRVDKGLVPGEKVHVHLKGKKGVDHALNWDGTWKHHGRDLTNAEKEFLEDAGWILP